MLASIRTIFGCDLRTLALIRILLGLIIIFDLGIRATNFTAHYSDSGAVPRIALLLMNGNLGASIHMLSGSVWINGLLFALAAIVAVALILGYRSRVAALFSWLLLISLDSRNQFISQGGDMLLRNLVFWLMFLPIGARFSIDSALDKCSPKNNDYFSIATLGLLVQVMCVYFFTALLKSDPVWLGEGTAVYYALANDTLILPFGEWLRQYPILLEYLTYFVWFLEISAAFLVFSPVFHLQVRLLALCLLITMHIAFFLCLDIGLFPFISITSLLAFTPPQVWEYLQQKWFKDRSQGIRVFYDGECLFCEKIVLILRTFLMLPNMQIAPAQPVADVHALMQKHDSWVVYDRTGNCYLRWSALAWLMSKSPLFAPIGYLLTAKWLQKIGEGFYAWVAANRSRLSNISRVLLPYRTLEHKSSYPLQLLCAVFVVTTLWINISSLKLNNFPTPGVVQQLASSFRLNQKWSMFAPAPAKISGWFVALGETKGGQPADVFLNRISSPVWSREIYLDHNYESYRWRKFLARLPLEERVEIRPYYLQYLCREWGKNHRGDDRLNWIKLYFVSEQTPKPGEQRVSERVLTWESDCGADPARQIIDLRRGKLPEIS